MASVTKRGSAYVVRYGYKDEQGKHRQGWETFSDEKEAKERARSIEFEMEKGTFLIPSSMTVRELLERWLPIQAAKHKWAPKTYEATNAHIQNLICPYIGNMEVQKVRPYHIEELYQTLSQTPCGQYVQGVRRDLNEEQQNRLLSGTTVNEVHGLLRTAFLYAVDWGLISKSPIPRDAPQKTINERAIWSEDEMAAALQEIEDPLLHLAVHLAFVGSLRQGELLGITPADLDFDAADGRGTISINKTLQSVSKKALEKCNSKSIYYVFPDKQERSTSSLILKPTKTKKSARVIFMTKPLKQELKAWLEKLEHDRAEAGERYKDSGMLFSMPNGDPVEAVLLRKWFVNWQEEHPKYTRIVFHALRHSSATYQLMVSDGDIKSVQGNTGHAQAGILVNTYAHIQDRARMELSDKFEADFYGKTKIPMDKPRGGAVMLTCQDLLTVIRTADPALKKELTLALLA